MYLQSLFFKLFGTAAFPERIYSLLCYALSLAIIILIWKTITNNIKMGWLPILFFILIPVVSWCIGNNMLENTMLVFTLLTLFFLIKYYQKKHLVNIILAGFMLFLAFLSKGFVCLYLWAFPFYYFIIFKNGSFKNSVLLTLLFVGSTVLPFILMITFFSDAALFFKEYFNKQIIGSIAHVNTVDSRFFIVVRCFTELLISIALFLVLRFAWKAKSNKQTNQHTYQKWSKVLLLLAISGVFPIMISLKQSGYYILTTYPLFALALSLPLHNKLLDIIENKLTVTISKWIKITTLLLLLVAVINGVWIYKFKERDKEKLEILDATIKTVAPNTTINITSEFTEDWGLHGYFMRYGFISLDANNPLQHNYLLANQTYLFDTLLYAKVVVTPNYCLLKKINPQ
jgi:4-amino-4-deoxy-L-arabinose transferase-like glycosyltransferase